MGRLTILKKVQSQYAVSSVFSIYGQPKCSLYYHFYTSPHLKINITKHLYVCYNDAQQPSLIDDSIYVMMNINCNS